jgi:hypothetical protein
MITEKSIFTLEIPNGLIKCVLVQFHIILHQRSSPSKHEGATLRKIGAKQYYVDSKHKKIVKNPLQKGTQSIGT